MKKIFVCFLALTILTLTACGKTELPEIEQPAEKAAPSEVEETITAENTEPAEPIEEAEETFTIDFAGLQLKYPKKWQDKIAVTVSDNKAAFACGDVQLFDLLANSNEGYVLGTVCGEEYTVLTVVSYDIEDDEDIELFAMAEDINVILQNLMQDYDFVVGEAVEKIDDSTVDIETSVTTLKYAGRWKDAVTIDVSEKKVSFSNNDTPLFDLVFSECDGYLLGMYNGTPIYIIDYPVTTDEQAAMQEDVNVILQYLMENPNFDINA